MKQLREHPEMMARVQSILELAYDEEGPLKTADEVEGLLIEEIRRLGNATMNQWASHAEERVSTELKQKDPTVLGRKKNTEVVVCLWSGRGTGPGLVHADSELLAPFARAFGSHVSRTVATIGAGADGLWQRAFLCPSGGERAGALWV